jgi:outer membrane receptor protein involved in Fe transport
MFRSQKVAMNPGNPAISRLYTIALFSLHLGIVAAAVSPSASAQEAASHRDTSADNEMLLADDMITTATKTVQRLRDSPAAATVITEEEIAQSGATTITELLRSVPGVDVMSPNQSQVNVSIRGFNQVFANKVLVMVDGRSINQDIQGNIFWNTEPLLVTRIKRIEIVRGPGSVLYGANAFGGVIDIITKTPEEMAAGKNPGTFLGAYGEQRSTFAETTYTLGKTQDWAVTLGAGFHGTTGFGSHQIGQVHDRSRVPIFTANLQKQVSHGSLLFSVNNSDATADLSADIVYQNADWHTNSAMLSYNEDRGANPIAARAYGNFLRLSSGAIYTASAAYNLEVQQQRRLSVQHDLIYGGSYRLDQFISSLTGVTRHSQHLAGLFLQDQYQVDAATSLFAGLRWDRHSVYGSQLSPRVSLVHHLTHDQSARLSYGTAFRAPTLIETYLNIQQPVVPGLDVNFLGNVNIKPEKVASTEAGYRLDLRNGYVGLNLFYNQITDIIESASSQFAPSPPFPPGIPTKVQFQNRGTAHAAGLELDGSFQIRAGWHGLANYSYQDVKNKDGQPTDFSPKHKINLALTSDESHRWTAYTAVHFVSSSSFATASLRAYTTLDARIGYKLGRQDQSWTISVAATNLLNDHHREFIDALSPANNAVVSQPMQRTLWLMVAGKL